MRRLTSPSVAALCTLALSLLAVSSASAKSLKEALWVVNHSGDSVAEFANGALATSGVPSPNRINLSADFSSPWGLVFDSSRNLWVSNVGNGTLTKFTLAQLKALKTNSSPAAQVVISGLDRPEGMAFDKKHNLWVANEGDSELLEFTPKELKSTGSPTPNVSLSSSALDEPVGVAFDKKGNIWVASEGFHEIVMFTAAQLKAGGTQTPAVILSSDGSGSLDNPEPIAFDKAGSLWVGNNLDPVLNSGSVVKFTPGQLTTTGSPTPAVMLTATTVNGTSAFSFDIPTGLALDKHGNVWVANEHSDADGSVAEFADAELANGSPQPAVFLDGGSNLSEPFFISFGPVLP